MNDERIERLERQAGVVTTELPADEEPIREWSQARNATASLVQGSEGAMKAKVGKYRNLVAVYSTSPGWSRAPARRQ